MIKEKDTHFDKLSTSQLLLFKQIRGTMSDTHKLVANAKKTDAQDTTTENGLNIQTISTKRTDFQANRVLLLGQLTQ